METIKFEYKILKSEDYSLNEDYTNHQGISYKVEESDTEEGQYIKIQVYFSIDYQSGSYIASSCDEYFIPYGQNIKDIVPATMELVHLSMGRLAGYLFGKYKVTLVKIPTLYELFSQGTL